MKELEGAWRRRHDERGRKRLQVLRLVAQHQLTAGQIAEAVGVGRWTVFNYLRQFQDGGVEKLLATGYAQRPPRGRVDAESAGQLRGKLAQGEFKRAKEAQAWLAGREVRLARKTVYYWLKKSRRGLESAAQDPRQKGRGQSGGVPRNPRRRTNPAGRRA
jgi:transposase